MKVEIDEHTFDENQIVLLNELIKSVDAHLNNLIPNISKRKDVVYNIIFSIGAIIDNSAVMEGKKLYACGSS